MEERQSEATQERYGLTITSMAIVAVGNAAFFVRAVSRDEPVHAALSFLVMLGAATVAVGCLVVQRRSRTKSG